MPKNPVRYGGLVSRSATGSLALGGAATALAVCVGAALLVLVPVPVGHGAPAAVLTVTAAPPKNSNHGPLESAFALG